MQNMKDMKDMSDIDEQLTGLIHDRSEERR